ncbi:hypothetical protein [Borrelia sp. P9F1]|uniref:hypothetical protein n=1 Tax=Borrelia sp. P9F1 TaxID=3058374 RepID=UPI00264997EB|nr:hypothetical protein [Borrelia sp. P9F1]WKC58728.1 hypothetical protein QYZ68_05855 [Borrelia sp. P9F1]
MSKVNIFILIFLLSTFIVSCKFWGEIDRKRGIVGLNNDGFSSVDDKDKLDKLLKDGFEFQVGDVEADKDKLTKGGVQGTQSGDLTDSGSNAGTGAVDGKDKLAQGDSDESGSGGVEADKDKLTQDGVQGAQSGSPLSSNTGIGDVDANDKSLQGSNAVAGSAGDKDKPEQGDVQGIQSDTISGNTGSVQGPQSIVASSSNTGTGSPDSKDYQSQGSSQGAQSGASSGSTGNVQGVQSSSSVASSGNTGASIAGTRDGSTGASGMGNTDKLAQGDVKGAQGGGADSTGVVQGPQSIVVSNNNVGTGSSDSKDHQPKGSSQGAQSGASSGSTGNVQGVQSSSSVASGSNTGANIAGTRDGSTGSGNTGDKDKLVQGDVKETQIVSDGAGSNKSNLGAVQGGNTRSGGTNRAQENQSGSGVDTSGVATQSKVIQSRIHHNGGIRHNENKEKDNRHPDLGVSNANKSLDSGLTQEDVKRKFNTLVSQVEEYEHILRRIYNDYIGASNTIKTYSRNNNGSYIREVKRGLDKLNERNLYDSFKRLGNIIKDHRYHQGLSSAVSSLKEMLESALATEKASYAIKAANHYLGAINRAIVAYVESFADVASTLSSGQFTQAAQRFAEVAKACAEINKTDLSTIAWAVSGVFLGKKWNLDQAKRAASQLYGSKGEELSRAIDALDVAYKGLKQ